MENTLRFWGVRGSTPAPGPATAGVGGNTTCMEVRLGGQRFILDGGTGIRSLGASEGGEPVNATLLFSHMHWDHIQGVPFFGPLYHPGSKFTLVGPEGLEDALVAQMSRPTFPVCMDAFGAEINFVTIKPGDWLAIGDVEISTSLLNHPGGAIGYRLRSERSTLVFACDHEQTGDEPDEALVELARNAEVLVYDAQYTPEEFPSRVGWGHSTYVHAAELAERAGVQSLYLTHHEPTRSDKDVELIERRARRRFARTVAAREGTIVLLGSDGMRLDSRDSTLPDRPSSVPEAS